MASVKKNEEEIPSINAIVSLPSNEISGLECLRTLDKLYIDRWQSKCLPMCGVRDDARFDIINEYRERLFHVVELTSFWQQLWCTSIRNFILSIYDPLDQEIIRINRPFKCCSGYTWCANISCCSQEVSVESPPENLIGTVSQIRSLSRYTYAIKDVNDNVLFTLTSPLFIYGGQYSCCLENKFTIFASDGVTEIGAFYRKYYGFLTEKIFNTGAYAIHFPTDLYVKTKALILAAVFLVDFMLFPSVADDY